MSFLAWIVLGLIAGFIASRVVNRATGKQDGGGLLSDILLGMAGSVIGGWIFSMLSHGFGGANTNAIGGEGYGGWSSGFSVWSLIVATLGAGLVLVVKHALMGDHHRLVHH